MFRAVIAFFPAVLGAYLLASVLATQVILSKVESLGLAVTLRDRLGASFHDIVGMATSYLPLLMIAFIVAMPVAALLSRPLPRGKLLLFCLAGAAAVVTLHLTLKAVLGLNGVAAVREVNGLALQAVAGAFGGYLYFVFTGRAHR